ncbi:hypothetical protein RKD19_003638 [Streptomyces canus]|uniref:hypothetical protein n=1 Tax=unclassified Streptomyces TaxID=2593676 RepID=UPI000F64C6F6|nr:hypothetical protein [Streptomyces sp. RP5T]RRR73930.1 hypothetical protein EHS43_36280 [Streptomyces sp. RP5T]
MPDGFSVDLGALRKAASGISTTLDAMATKKVSDIDVPKGDFGHDELASAIVDFTDRWNIGVSHLASDGTEVSDRLNRCVKNYEAAEDHIQLTAEGMLRSSSGTDPGAS